MRFFVLCLCLGAVASETPFAGYAPSGWRPQGAQLRLPTEYGAPLVQQKVDVKITKENIAHAAEIAETTTELFPNIDYLPPTTTDLPELDPIRVQGLPDNKLSDFQRSNSQQSPQFNNKRVKPLPQIQQQQPIFPISAQLRALAANNFQFGRQEQEYPSNSYGVPTKNNPVDDNVPEDPQTTDLPTVDDNEDEQNQQATSDGQTVITVSNAFSGQYYVLGPDNNLQRVMFSTSQSDEDRRNMGFTAQLRYSAVEPIRGPVYAYNEQGQLIRIYK
ncbi:uncharacterized protein LOC129768259 [Toxorhynchites rutilus septentrionalis]|uniref:uncharacterized protein LOC129768259 n=1 Tax=Toxorhynchites rutilus septentrionalis TaxID=329112 RepID=UPI002478726C|nr:uncharacterized protein LOC129768259 [Toxorhynchites rutilus septentrionalis]